LIPSNACLDLIRQFEGCKLQAYQDQRGIWTIGFGATGGAIGPETVWTQQQADSELLIRVNGVGAQVNHKIQPILKQCQFDALCSLVYNIGIGNFTGSKMIRLLNGREWKQAADEFLVWNHINGTVSAGLSCRREAERALFLS